MERAPSTCLPAVSRHAAAAAVFGALAATTLIHRAAGLSRTFLSQDVDFGSHFSLPAALLRLAFVAVVMVYCWVLGRWVARAWGLAVSGGVATAIGVVALNVLLLPLFFLRLLHYGVLVALFAALSAALSGEFRRAFQGLWGRRVSPWVLLIALTPVWLHFLSALVPVHMEEALGDIADTYLFLPMSFAARHGASFLAQRAASVASFLNWEVLASTLVALTSPEAVKLFGWAVFALTAFLAYDMARSVCGERWGLVAPILFLACPIFADDTLFSFVHPRGYFLFVSSLVLLLVLRGSQEGKPRFQHLALLALGVLVGTSMAGAPTAVVLFGLFVGFGRPWRGGLRRVIVALVFCGILGAIFPVWNYANSGSFNPTYVPLNELLGLEVSPDIYNRYLWDRVSLQFVYLGVPPWVPRVLFPVRFVWEHFSVLAYVFVAGLLFLRRRALLALYIYVLANTHLYLLVIPNSVYGGHYARFHWVTLPALSVLLACVTSALASWGGRLLEALGCARRWAARLAGGAGVAAVAASLAVSGWWIAWGQRSWQARQQLHFLTGRASLATYLGWDIAAKAAFLNASLGPAAKALYLFREQGIYVKPQLYQATELGAASIIYRETDPQAILDKLQGMGIGYLCVDTLWRPIGKSPEFPMVADVLTPIFQPSVFAEHFVPLGSPVRGFYVFRIAYGGVGDAAAAERNFQRVARTGFFRLIHQAVTSDSPVTVPSNPYPLAALRTAYEAAAPRFLPPAAPGASERGGR